MTIIEVVIATSIIILISSVSIINYKKDNYQIEYFAKSLCSDIRYVRMENILENNSVYIRFVEEDNRWSYILHKNKSQAKKITLPENVSLNYPKSSNCSFIQFNEKGSFKNGGGTIRISKDNEYKDITIVPVSGRILYKEGIYEK